MEMAVKSMEMAVESMESMEMAPGAIPYPGAAELFWEKRRVI
jgi:hypothetical protein